MIRLIRSFRPDLILTHRSNDYHPDHRFAGLLVQDASYLLTVPAICPEVPHLAACPVILHFSDAFTRPCRFEPHVVVDIDAMFDRLVGMLHRHESQFYEWLPYNAGYPGAGPAGRRRPPRVAGRADARAARAPGRPLSRPGRADLRRRSMAERVRLIEAFEVSEYGAPLDPDARARLFPFLPPDSRAASPFTRKQWVDLPEGE